jgi:uncharacterized protein YceH (UPF0502 family)
MTFNKSFVPSRDEVTRAISNMSLSAEGEFKRLEERIKALEATVIALSARLTAHGI